MSEARTEDRLGRLEAVLARLEPMIVRIDERVQHVADAAAVARIEATLPYLATKAELTAEIAALRVELADKPGKVWLATAIGVLLVAYTAGLAGLAALPVLTKLVQ
jgi:hypothetical protein